MDHIKPSGCNGHGFAERCNSHCHQLGAKPTYRPTIENKRQPGLVTPVPLHLSVLVPGHLYSCRLSGFAVLVVESRITMRELLTAAGWNKVMEERWAK